MIDRLIKYVESLQLFSPTDSILVGVSGGIDSVVLADLLYKAGYSFALVHCNFNLRDEESDGDEAFVKALAAKYDKTYYGQSFDTKQFALNKGISIEMAARDLRYRWFEEIRHTRHYDWIAVAHHRDDQVETFFLNLTRSTGISGLTGMKTINGKVVRPLLFATRKEIESYARQNRLSFREDSSNLKNDFHRNKIRNLVLPVMEEINPSFRNGVIETMSHLADVRTIYNQAIEQATERVIFRRTSGEIELSIPEVKLLNPIAAYLFEMLRPYHFNGDVVEELVNALDGQPGKQFFSSTHRAVIDRDIVVIQEISSTSDSRYYLEDTCSEVNYPVKLTLDFQKKPTDFKLNKSSEMAMIDRDRLQFPLILRKWQKGDYFQPLGMKGIKKLSDFFVDEKFSLSDKENVWLLTNGEEIVWIIGVRLDDRYKIRPNTTNMLIISLI